MRYLKKTICSLFFLAALFSSPYAEAFEIIIKEAGKNRHLKDVVVALYPEVAAPVSPGKAKQIVQRRKLFNPYVTVIPRGTQVTFPNLDRVRHNVYSFSKAKQFEFPLFHGEGETVLLDKAGIVSVGCNIHDWMIAYIVIVDTPYYTKTGESGIAKFNDIPDGTYTIKHWYPGLKSEEMVVLETKAIKSDGQYKITLPRGKLKLKPRRPSSANGSSGY